MKLLVVMVVLLLPGCAYTARDIYRHDHEIVLLNESEDPVAVHVTHVDNETVTNVAEGERRTVFYGKVMMEDQRKAKVRAVRQNHTDSVLEVSLVPGQPSFFKLWQVHDLIFTPSGDLNHER